MSLIFCRLCKGTEFLCSLFEDGQSLQEKITFCVDLTLYPEDGLPTMICKFCKREILRFYKFKQKCLQVNSELRNIKTEAKHESTQLPSAVKEESIDSADTLDVQENQDESRQLHNSMDIKVEETSHTSVQCDLCGSIYSSKLEYRKHLSTHKGARLYQCKFCYKNFTRAESKAIHMRSHLGIRPYVCEICGQSSTKPQDLKRHMKIHSDERNYECQSCGRRFKRSTDLHSHLRTHTGEKPYKCSNCNKAYTSHSGLKKHQKNHPAVEHGGQK